MSENLYERYRRYSDRIEQVSMDYAIELAVAAFSDPPIKETSEEAHSRAARERNSILTLTALRISQNLELMRKGKMEYKDQLTKDFNEVCNAFSWLTGVYPITDKVKSEAATLISIVVPETRDAFLDSFNKFTGCKIKSPFVIRPEVYITGLSMIRYCLENKLLDEMRICSVGLVELSSEKNLLKHDLHRTVVIQCLDSLVDIDSQLAFDICEKQKPHFNQRKDENAALFYWFYAFSCQDVGRYEEALPLLSHCSQLCFDIEGEQSWLGARSLEMYHRIKFLKDNDASHEMFLWDFVRKVESGYYIELEVAEVECAIVRYVLLRHHMENQTLRSFLPDVKKHLEFCIKHEEIVCDPRLTVRSAKNMLSEYYLEVGDFLQAEQTLQNALATLPPEGVNKMPSDDLIRSNLLHMYSQLNDEEKMIELASYFEERLEDNDLSEYERNRYFVLIQAANNSIGGLADESINAYKKSLADTYTDIQNGMQQKLDAGGIDAALRIVAQISSIGDTFSASKEQLYCYQSIIRYFLSKPQIYKCHENHLMVMYMELARINWSLGNKDALSYIQQSLAYGNGTPEFSMHKITVLRIAALIDYYFGYSQRATEVAKEALNCITGAWHNVISYMSDHRICQVLATTQLNFNLLYAVLNAQLPEMLAYDYLLRYKDLPSLVGRERNRFLNTTDIDRKLLNRVYHLQDELANAELSDSLHGTDTVTDISRELKIAEANFSKEFPSNLIFTNISLKEVGEKLKDHEAIIEYYFVPDEKSLLRSPGSEMFFELDVFLIFKEHRQVKLERIRIADGDNVIEDAAAFIEIMQDPDHSKLLGEKELIRSRLSHKLLDSAVQRISHVTTIYLAPDLTLCNLPFEILYLEDGIELQNHFKVCRLTCGRDILFFKEKPTCGSGAFVLGDPDYEAEQGEISSDFQRRIGATFEPVYDLPFSRVEAERIARRCRSTPYTGKRATKYALQAALPCRIIHLATHGSFDESMESNSLYSSFLIFAGYNRWASNKVQSKYCGNGILTADEISRMDLNDTELVVLSACNSGMGDYSYRSVKGLLSAFSAAGVRWVICHIWNADDFTTPILMDAFYDSYLIRGLDVPEALQYAKQRLRIITIRELREEGWLTPDLYNRLSADAKVKLEKILKSNDRRRPFADEKYWGGFVCYRCQ